MKVLQLIATAATLSQTTAVEVTQSSYDLWKEQRDLFIVNAFGWELNEKEDVLSLGACITLGYERARERWSFYDDSSADNDDYDHCTEAFKSDYNREVCYDERRTL